MTLDELRAAWLGACPDDEAPETFDAVVAATIRCADGKGFITTVDMEDICATTFDGWPDNFGDHATWCALCEALGLAPPPVWEGTHDIRAHMRRYVYPNLAETFEKLVPDGHGAERARLARERIEEMLGKEQT